MKVLVLGGTGEARRLAERLHGRAGVHVVTSLAGRVAQPTLPVGEVRVGGFGGVEGLVAYLRDSRVDVLVDATHPFAARISASAASAAASVRLPFLVLRRAEWVPVPGDDWRTVPTLAAAAALVDELGERVFLTTGRQSLAAFAHLERPWFLARSVDPPEPPLPPRLHVLLDRGPFTVEGEVELLRRYTVNLVVTKNSGGPMTAAKLVAARSLGLPVVMVERPAAGLAVASVDEALEWVLAQAG
jgi:precorrin-6A/cobalt-precorrin-6A reductase